MTSAYTIGEGDSYILRLAATNRELAAKVGNKAAALGELAARGFDVPDGFCITTGALMDIMNNLQLSPTLDPTGLANVREQLLHVAMPRPLGSAIARALTQLYLVDESYPMYAVRSSSSVEDSARSSHAGQFSTFIVSGENVEDAIRRCWASLYQEAAINQSVKEGAALRGLGMSVLVQSLVPAAKSGVMFTSDPITGERTTIIEVAWGLGESVVGGKVTPDHIRISGDNISYTVGSKKTAILAMNGSTHQRQLDPSVAGARCLDTVEINRLGSIGARVDKILGPGQDIEFAISNGTIWLLQARPITSIASNSVGEGGVR